MDFKFINNNSNTLFIVFNSNNYDSNKFEFENYLNNFFQYKNTPSYLYLRDVYLQWYYNGIKGFSKNYQETIDKINDYKNLYKFQNIICMGSSSGGYASLYFGCKLNVNNIICFSPQIELIRSRELYYNKFKKIFENLTIEEKEKFNLTKLINEHKNKIFIFWVNYSDFYNITKRQNTYVYQNLNDEESYNAIKENENIEHNFIKDCNHCDVAYTTIKNGLFDAILKKFNIFKRN